MSPNVERVINRLFAKLQGIYGTSFTNKFSSGLDRNGVDQGFENAKVVWADELSGFMDNLEAIGYALQNVDPKFPPSAREFLQLCRAAPRKQPIALEHKPTPEERQHQSEMAKRIGDAIGAGKMKDGIDQHWATHPRSSMHLGFIFDAAKNDARFRPCVAQMVADGICADDGHLLMAYRDGFFVKA